MSNRLVDDELWNIIEPLLPWPKRRRKKNPGRSQGVPNRAALTGILFVLRSGIAWQMLPKEMGCGSGSTYWRRLEAWQRAKVWDRLHQVLLSKLRGAERIDFSRAIADSFSIRALELEKTGPKPTDRRRPGSKHHVLTDAKGIPLSAILTKANRNDFAQLLSLVEAIPPIAGKPGRPKRKPALVQADRGYDSNPHRAALKARGIQSQIARR